MPPLYANGSVFTVDFDPISGETGIHPGGQERGPNDQSFDMAVVELGDHGNLENPAQPGAAAEWIANARDGRFSANGVITVVFIHGWHHGAEWEDSHFSAFRRLLSALAVREMERPVARRVIGVYVAWNGDPRSYWFRGTPVLTHLSFRGRYNIARRIGESKDLRRVLQMITDRTKEPRSGSTPGQLILVGHSMGGLILESALEFLTEENEMLKPAEADHNWPIKTHVAGQSIVFPDAVISLNSAADSQVCKRLKKILAHREVIKRADSQRFSYSPPLLVSATAKADKATRVAWRITRPFRKTIGHDEDLLTHDFSAEEGTVECRPRDDVPDFGQNFHVLRPPVPDHSSTPRMRVDLPVRERLGLYDRPPHRRYRLDPRGPVDEARSIWNFQLPPEIVKDHNDIFNSRAASLILALMQISGTVGSLAPDWESSFEDY